MAFGLGPAEIAIIGVVVLVVFGPKKLPELGGAIGKSLRNFKSEMDKPSPEKPPEPPGDSQE